MTNSVIFRDVLENLGWFDTDFAPIAKVNYIYKSNDPRGIDSQTQVAYYPGCFAHFHDGHKQLIDQWLEETETSNKIIVISPANTDYTYSKYGDVVEASNKSRFDQIKKWVDDHPLKDHIFIDLNPMLNFTQDQNFTDLMGDFLRRQGFTFSDMNTPMTLICGKDRDNYKKLAELTNKIKVYYQEDSTGFSSSKMGFTARKKKHLILRCNSKSELLLFESYFEDQYESITPSYLDDEIASVRNIAYLGKDVFTICKDYAAELPYIPFHRKWKNPFERDGFETSGDFANTHIIDSDSYTGSTKSELLRLGASEVQVILKGTDPEFIEIIDYADFKDPMFRYPYTDITERCSMQPFTNEMHLLYNVFLDGVK